MPGKRLTILVAAMIAAVPRQGGWTWAVLQYLLGLKRLGHDVIFIEPIESPTAEQCRYFDEVVSQFGLKDVSTLLRRGEKFTFARQPDVLLNISGMRLDPEWVEKIPIRVYIDLDPLFTQVWASQGIDMRMAGHTHFATVGLTIGTPDSEVPTAGVEWIAMLPPVVLDEWPSSDSPEGSFTTVANWRGYGTVEHKGVFYGQKVHSFRQLIDLPKRATNENFLLALAIHPNETKDIALLNENGWAIVDPAQVSATPDAYRKFIQNSRAEIGIAKTGYVISQCGWLSDRSVCYLASGRPVLAHETGFSRFLPTGEGLLSFTSTDDAAAGAEQIRADYKRHSRAARKIAEDHLDSDKVLSSLLRRIGAVS